MRTADRKTYEVIIKHKEYFDARTIEIIENLMKDNENSLKIIGKKDAVISKQNNHILALENKVADQSKIIDSYAFKKKEDDITIDELKYIIENISKIMKPSSNLNHELLTYLKQKINCISEDDLLKIEYAIANTLCNCINNRDEVVSKIRNLLIDVATSEKVSLLDIRKIDYGAYSQIYRLGEKVIKIGLNRAVENIIDNRLILIPDYKGFIGSEYIEITDYIEIDNEGVTFNDLYMMYEELREQGITWLDPSEENVTRVDQKTLDKIKKKDKKKLGFDTNLNYNNKELVVGDLIIIDLDHLISTDDINMIKHIKYNLNEIIVEKLDYFEKIYNERHKTKCLTLKNVRI